MDVHVVLPENRHLYRREIDQSHQLRAKIFVDEHKWKELSTVDGREADQFDTPAALYILALEPELGVVGGMRLHCSLDPTLLSEIFPHGAERGFERAHDVYEWTRIFIVPERREPKPSRVCGALQVAALRYCLAQGVRLMNMVTYAWYVPAMMKSGLRIRPLGLPFQHEDMTLITCAGTVSLAAVEAMNAFYDLGDWSPLSRGRGNVLAVPEHRLVA